MPDQSIDALSHGAADSTSPAEDAGRKPFVTPVVEELGGLTQLTEVGGSL